MANLSQVWSVFGPNDLRTWKCQNVQSHLLDPGRPALKLKIKKTQTLRVSICTVNKEQKAKIAGILRTITRPADAVQNGQNIVKFLRCSKTFMQAAYGT